MPPYTPLPTYKSSFLYGPGAVMQFDVQPHGYRRETKANATVRAVPWAASTYGVVIQSAGNEPERLTLTVTWWAQAAYEASLGFVGALGTLVTPRYPGGLKAWLESAQETDTDRASPDGPVKGSLTFVLLGQPAGVIVSGGNPVVTGGGAPVGA